MTQIIETIVSGSIIIVSGAIIISSIAYHLGRLHRDKFIHQILAKMDEERQITYRQIHSNFADIIENEITVRVSKIVYDNYPSMDSN